jgi:transposase InsO family protein
MPTKKRNFTEEFREEAVRLALTSDHPHHDTALNLGVDISYIWTREGWLYLAVVIDLYARRVVGHACSSSKEGFSPGSS